ncbi:hypothetical protein LTR53_003154 [Teratosphaeriaceae sp. CCFEE 6253]|nr:hypothetical protein LTR53_003154 [Teratosphaeriaceae sp. CCFEE 6253]
MLHWLAGQKQSEGPSDPDATGYIEAPETPAPVFAVRAFKHAIFGTPQTAQPKVRRHSTTENARPRPQGSRPDRPNLSRPKSAENARGLARDDDAAVPSPMASPTKGILMTPGAAGTKRKTVTFGEHVTNNGDKRPTKSGLPDDCPGKFPSPWAKPGADVVETETPLDKSRGRSKLTEALEQVRDESAKRNSKSHKRNKSRDEGAIAEEMEEAVPESALYWKTQYDVYRDNSQREIKKLITKQKAAKSFAREKDFQCTELADELRLEQKKVEKLEKRRVELEAQLEAMREQLNRHRGVDEKAGVLPTALVPTTQDRRASPPAESAAKPAERHVQPKVVEGPPSAVPATATAAPSSDEQQPAPSETDKAIPPPEATKARARARPTSVRTKTSDDIWNQSLNSSSPAATRSTTKRSTSPRAVRAVTSGTGATPLMSLNVNTLPTTSLARRDSAQPSPPSDRFAKEPLVRQEVARSPKPEEERKASPVLSREMPLPLPDAIPAAAPPSPKLPKPATIEITEELSMPLPASSPFQPSPVISPPGIAAKKSYFDRMAEAPVKSVAATSTSTCSTLLPSKPLSTENIKPTAAWNAINAPNVGKRVVSVTDKAGKELGIDRIEAAKARMAARGRVLS